MIQKGHKQEKSKKSIKSAMGEYRANPIINHWSNWDMWLKKPGAFLWSSNWSGQHGHNISSLDCGSLADIQGSI